MPSYGSFGARLCILALLVLPLVALAGGCTQATGADGKATTGQVYFDEDGVAHCPFCDGVVEPFHNLCENEHTVVWGTDDVPCKFCDGSGVCTTCSGSGVDPYTGGDCPDCIHLDEDGIASSTGVCTHCGGEGVVRYGWHGPDADPLGEAAKR